MPSAIRIIDQAAEIVVDASGFTGNLGLTDTDVQTALATVDGLSIGAGGTPGGTTKQIQFNSAGSFGGAAGFEYQAGASPNVLIQAQNAAYIPLTVKAAASQTANTLEVQKSDASLAGGFDALGRVFSYGNPAETSNFFTSGAGNATVTGLRNVGAGVGALVAVAGGYNNVGIGTNALNALTSGYNNFGLGYLALAKIVGGYENLGVGVAAMSNTGVSVNSNVAVGGSALKDVTSSKHTAIGYVAGYSKTSGEACIFIGYTAGYYQTTAANLLIVDNQLRANAATELTNSILYGVMAALPVNQVLRVNAGLRLSVDSAGLESTTTLTGVTDTPTADPGWTASSTVNMTAPDGYIKAYVGTQAVVIPYWNT